MIGDDVNERKNQKLKKYVKEKEAEGLHIPKQEEVKGLLQELGQKAGLNDIPDQIALLMYLTGMEGEYWLSMNHAESNNHGRGAFRDMVDFSVIDRGLGGGVNNAGGNLCMIGGEGE